MSPITDAVRGAFLDQLATTGCVKTAAGGYGAGRFYAIRRAEPEFAAAWDDALARWTARQLTTIELATAPAPDGKPGDWKAAAWLLERQERRREGAAKLALLRAQVEQTRKRNDGSLPAERIDVTSVTKVDLTDPDAIRARLAELAALAARRADAGGAAGVPVAGGGGERPADAED